MVDIAPVKEESSIEKEERGGPEKQQMRKVKVQLKLLLDEGKPKKTTEERKSTVSVDYDVVAHLRRIPARLSIYEALQLSQEAREALINALTD